MENITRQEFEELKIKVGELEKAVCELNTKKSTIPIPVSETKEFQNLAQKKQTHKRDITEETIGKYGLPIAATVMIIGGIGVLSYMVWNYIPDIGKALGILLLGIACIGIGYFFHSKEKMQPFQYSMIALGLTICYTDIIISRWAWYLISKPITMILIIAWSFLTAWLSHRYKKKFFYVILEIGLAITAFVSVTFIEYDLSGLILMWIILLMYGLAFAGYYHEFKESHLLFSISFLSILAALNISQFSNSIYVFYPFLERITYVAGIFVACYFYQYLTNIPGKCTQTISKIILIGIVPVFLYTILFFRVGIYYSWNEYEKAANIIAAILAFTYVFFITTIDNSQEALIPAFLHMMIAALLISYKLGCGTFGFCFFSIFLYFVSEQTNKKQWEIPFVISDLTALAGYFLISKYWNGNEAVPYVYGMVEYGLIIALIAVALISALNSMSGGISTIFGKITDELN